MGERRAIDWIERERCSLSEIETSDLKVPKEELETMTVPKEDDKSSTKFRLPEKGTEISEGGQVSLGYAWKTREIWFVKFDYFPKTSHILLYY